MSNRKLAKAIQGFFHALTRLHQAVTKGLVNWLLRSALKKNRGNRLANSGFVLPTTVLLILVVTLTVGALTYRAYNRNAQVIGENQQRIIYNAATPAIDRARSKLEFLFDASKDNRYPGGVPSEGRLLSMLLNDGEDSTGAAFAKLPAKDKDGKEFDPYKLPDETRVDLNKDGRDDNAWSFRTDTDGNGESDATVVYSVIFSSPTEAKKNPQELLLTKTDKQKAEKLWVRQGPLSRESSAVQCGSGAGGAEGGWFEDRGGNTSILRKNFQVDAMVIPDAANSTAVTLEFQQDRQLNRGNKWGAWFRNDLEVFPVPPFNWNGATHTEGSLMLGNNSFTAHLISAPASCLFSPADNSGITVTDTTDFKGTVVAGMMKDDNTNGKADIYIYDTKPRKVELNSGTDSTKGGIGPSDVSIDPKLILTEDKYRYRSGKTKTEVDDWTNLKDPGLAERMISKGEDKPFVDDLYRADDRWGPKPKYGTNDTARTVPSGEMGKDIPAEGNSSLILKDGSPPDGTDVGLDGYWERRARFNGLRILVGERLELGNLNTWVTPRDTNGDSYITQVDPNNPGSIDLTPAGLPVVDEREGDPLYPPTIAPYPISKTDADAKNLKHLDLQRRTLRDNLSAVQTTAIYHAAKDKDYPVACLASTVHPGTLSTLYQSINFKETLFANGLTGTVNPATNQGEKLQSNFFTGQGTNGWEFSAPSGTAVAFETAMNTSTSPLRTALQNLANFAGDPDGVFPLKPTDTKFVHPYPALSMWGNFSNLRRVLGKLNSSTTYANLSIADKTYLQTAACTIGVLAYNIDQIQKFDPTNPNNDAYDEKTNTYVLERLALDLRDLMNGSEVDGEVLPKGQLNSTRYTPNNPTLGGKDRKDRDYEDVPPEAWVGALKQKLLQTKLAEKPTLSYQAALAETLNEPRVKMAELIMLKYQIRRDRAFGFRSSPAFGSYVGQVGSTPYTLPSACDPDEFAFNSAVLPATVTGYRLALSRLCGALDTTKLDPTKYVATDRAWVLPKFPALYYIFPETDHNLYGDLIEAPLYDHRQPGPKLKSQLSQLPSGKPADVLANNDNRAKADEEPYVKDTYVTDANINGSVTFKRVSSVSIPKSPVTATPASRPYVDTTPFPEGYDYSLGSEIALTPRLIDSSPTDINGWKLPHTAPKPSPPGGVVSGGPNVSPNIIMTYGSDGKTNIPIAVPFLDRAFFDGRQVMLMRSLDIDLGMLRSNAVPTGTDVWLPESGIVYAFREDAVREDAITRPVGTETDLRNPAAPTDPPFTSGISIKAVDDRPDPERRVHGFRLRNGSEVKRKDSLLEAAKNIRGLSFFTDQPVYIQGDFNLHQGGSEDTAGARLEEFTEQLPDNVPYSESQFYGRKTTNYDNFSASAKDRWRPSEILADSIGILSNDFCDGSIADTFVAPDLSKTTVADFSLRPDNFGSTKSRDQYGDPNGSGLFGPGCTGNGYTSFHNRNISQKELPAPTVGGKNVSWDWVRENSSNATLPQRNNDPQKNYWADFTSPIKISRAGQPLIEAPQGLTEGAKKPALPRPVLYGTRFGSNSYYPLSDLSKKLMAAKQTRVNSIVVSGIVPSRKGQSYGGLHNFPRFLETWNGSVPLNFSGSFLQLSFSNYGTAPYEQEGWEIPDTDLSQENIYYYVAPARIWGYDVGLQLSPAGPAATRFVTSSKNRNEFYNEPAVNDPYINQLCKAAKAVTDKNFGPKDTDKVNCPS